VKGHVALKLQTHRIAFPFRAFSIFGALGLSRVQKESDMKDVGQPSVLRVALAKSKGDVSTEVFFPKMSSDITLPLPGPTANPSK